MKKTEQNRSWKARH